MTTRKTASDIRRERHAHEINATLIGTGISVCGGGGKGPYTVCIDRLDRPTMTRVVSMLRRAVGWPGTDESD